MTAADLHTDPTRPAGPVSGVHPGRRTHGHDGPLVLFLLGMRINRPRAVSAWLPVFRAMPVMVAELQRRPELGLVHSRFVLGRHGPEVHQLWRDVESLHAYASSTEGAHRPAWQAFNQRARQAGAAVGIWHETFVVPAGGTESMYVNMPPRGLSAAYGMIPVAGHRTTAAQRLATTAR